MEPSRISSSSDQLGKGGVVVVWKLDRLSRSLKNLLAILEKIEGERETIDCYYGYGHFICRPIPKVEFEKLLFRPVHEVFSK